MKPLEQEKIWSFYFFLIIGLIFLNFRSAKHFFNKKNLSQHIIETSSRAFIVVFLKKNKKTGIEIKLNFYELISNY
ncbi:hypothetical protein BpHYR1_025705 [Brachionus plicatilis]|uniref:Uncharacterized protein n=1 Tax=Brachionus plicatilis TaxID=10195 RepID=A0A3M7RF30_BRAPC|nr:hypothetical protein BpHYR1_025705 [Brachionus plicatilis]